MAGGKATLTEVQYEFMLALQDAVRAAGGPASVPQIVARLGKSDSRVRSHIKKMMSLGFVCCVGKSRHNKYVPGNPWLKEAGDEAFRSSCVGGICQGIGCKEKAVDCFAGRYLCRDCMMGDSSKADPVGRDDYYDRFCGLSSVAGWGTEEESKK